VLLLELIMLFSPHMSLVLYPQCIDEFRVYQKITNGQCDDKNCAFNKTVAIGQFIFS